MARSSPSVDRVVSVIELLAEHPDRGFSLTEVCRRLDLNKATAHALLSSLTRPGATAFTVMPSGPSSRAAARVSPSTAAFEAT